MERCGVESESEVSFDKDYPNRKDQRKPYIKRCERIDRTCRPGGSCPWCSKNRKHRTEKRKPIEEER